MSLISSEKKSPTSSRRRKKLCFGLYYEKILLDNSCCTAENSKEIFLRGPVVYDVKDASGVPHRIGRWGCKDGFFQWQEEEGCPYFRKREVIAKLREWYPTPKKREIVTRIDYMCERFGYQRSIKLFECTYLSS